MSTLQTVTRLYVIALVLATVSIAALLVPGAVAPHGDRLILAAVFAILTAITLLVPLKIGFKTNLALDTTVLFAAVLLFDPLVAMGIATLGFALAQALRRRDGVEVIFNWSQTAAQVGVGGYLLRVFGWDPNQFRFDQPLNVILVLSTALVMYAMNTLAVASVIRVQSGEPPFTTLLRASVRADHMEHATQVLLGLVGAILVDSQPWALPLLVLPAVAVYRSLERQMRLDEQTIERAALYEAEQRARAEAEAAVRAREQFVSIAAHELKTPLTSLKANAQLLARELRQPQWDRTRIVSISGRLGGQVDRLEGLISELLDATRMRQNRLELSPAWTDLAALTREVVEQFAFADDPRLHHPVVLDAESPVTGYWDAGRVEQVVINLVANALKYSAADTEVRVTVRARGEVAELIVRDKGVGIPPADRERLFEPYARSRVVARRIEGMGLGLYISEQIVKRHGGEIEVESELGAGSTFMVRLPIVPPGFKAPAPPSRDATGVPTPDAGSTAQPAESYSPAD